MNYIESFKAEIAKKIKESESGYVIDGKTALELYYVYIYEKNLVDDFEKYKENLIKGKLKMTQSDKLIKLNKLLELRDQWYKELHLLWDERQWCAKHDFVLKAQSKYELWRFLRRKLFELDEILELYK